MEIEANNINFETVVIVPNFNGIHLIKECFNSLRDQTYKNFKIILVDDESTDQSIKFISELFPEVKILKNKKNIGFAGSINNGINYAILNFNPKYIAPLNNDTKADKNWLKRLISAAESEDKIAAVASNMFFYDNPEIINSQGGMCNFIGLGVDINYGKPKKNVDKTKKYVSSACFGAALIKTNSLKEIGLLDDRFFAYYEDIDWGWRANLLGYKIIFEKTAVVLHKGSATFNDPSKKNYLCLRNSLCTIIKNYSAGNLTKALLLTALHYASFSGSTIMNKKKEKGKFKKATIPLAAIIWNIKNLKKTLELRKNIQNSRKVDDKNILDFNEKK